jgi:hypothetical protein
VTEASIGTEPRWTESRPSSRWLPRLDIAELWSYRELAFFLALRDLKLRYKQTVFGVSRACRAKASDAASVGPSGRAWFDSGGKSSGG